MIQRGQLKVWTDNGRLNAQCERGVILSVTYEEAALLQHMIADELDNKLGIRAATKMGFEAIKKLMDGEKP